MSKRLESEPKAKLEAIREGQSGSSLWIAIQLVERVILITEGGRAQTQLALLAKQVGSGVRHRKIIEFCK